MLRPQSAAAAASCPCSAPQLAPRASASGFYQRRVAAVRLLGELYNYKLVNSHVIFATLHLILAYGLEPSTPPEVTRWVGRGGGVRLMGGMSMPGLAVPCRRVRLHTRTHPGLRVSCRPRRSLACNQPNTHLPTNSPQPRSRLDPPNNYFRIRLVRMGKQEGVLTATSARCRTNAARQCQGCTCARAAAPDCSSPLSPASAYGSRPPPSLHPCWRGQTTSRPGAPLCPAHPRPSYVSPLPPSQPPLSFSALQVCGLLGACGQFFSRGAPRRKLDTFLPYLQRYLLAKPPLPLDVEFDVQVTQAIASVARMGAAAALNMT